MRHVIVLLLMTLLLPLSVWAECTPAQLLAELQADPAGLGYAAAYGKPITAGSSGSDQAVLDVINQIRTGAGFQLNRGTLSGLQMQAALNPGEFAALTVLEQTQLQTLFVLGRGTVDVSRSNVRTIILNLFPAGGPTVTALQAIVSRDASQAEKVCGSQRTLRDISVAIRGAA